MYAQGQVVWQAGLFNLGTVDEATNFGGGTLTLSGGDGRVLQNRSVSSGLYKADASGDTVEFAAGTCAVTPGGSTGGVLLVSGANVTMSTGSGTSFGSDLDVEAGTLNFDGTWTGQQLTLGGGSFGGSGGLTVNSFAWKGGTLGDGLGSLTVSGSSALISTSAEHLLAAPYTLNLNGGNWFGGGKLHALVPSSSTAVFYIYNKSSTFYISDPGSFVVDPKLGGAQYVVFANESGATVYMYAQGQVVWQAGLFNLGTVDEATNFGGGTLTLSGGDGRVLQNRSVSSGLYKADASGDTVEFAAGTCAVTPGGSTGGVLLVSGANVTMSTGSGTSFGSDLDVEAGTLNFDGTWTGQQLTLGGGSFGGSGGLTVNSFAWKGGTLGDGLGSLTVSGSSALISTSAEHLLAAPYTLNLNGGNWFGGGKLHALVPSSSTAVFYIYNKSSTYYISDPGSFVVDPKLGGAQYVVFANESGATVYMYAQGQVVWQAGLFNLGTVDEATNFGGGTLTLSGGDGRVLQNRSVSSGLYKADASGDTVEFAAGTCAVTPGGSTGGVLLVSGANVTMSTGSGTSFGSDLDVEAGTLNFDGTWTGQQLTLGGGSFGGSGGLTVNSFAWKGGTLGDGLGSLTVSGSSALISTSAEHLLAAPYTLNLNGGNWFGGGKLHALVPSSSTAVFYIYNKSSTFYISDPGSFVVDPKLGGAQYVVFANESGATVYMYAQGQVVWQAGLFNLGTVDEATNFGGGTLTLSGGDGRVLQNRSVSSGLYKADASGDTVEFAAGTFAVTPGGSTGGVLLVSGANVTMSTGSGTSFGSDLDRKSTRLNSSHEWTSYAVFCVKRRFGGSGGLTVNSF